VFPTATGPNQLSSDDAELTPIFDALAGRVREPDGRSRSAASAAPVPPGPAGGSWARPRAIPGEQVLVEPRQPGDAAWSAAHARHAAPVSSAITAPTVAMIAVPPLGAHRSAPGAPPALGAHRSTPGAHRAAEPTAEARCGGRHRALRAVSHGTG
jgi:hypothetical protein